jgi:Peptidase A4 family
MNRALGALAGAGCGLAVLGLAAPSGRTAAGAAHAAGHGVIHVVHPAGGRVNTNQSNNWSGYNIGAAYPGEPVGVRFTAVSGEWTVPAATQHKHGQAEFSASWVGIGGGCVTDNCQVTDNTLIQAGTEQDVSTAGRASYRAWWEIIPEPQTTVSLPVRPGNKIKVSIALASTPGDWSIVIENLTTGRRFATTTPYTSSMDTAEWIEETPLIIGTGGTGVAAMPSLGTVHFTSAALNKANPGFQTIDEIQLTASNGTVIATPSGPGPALTSFNDCIWKTTCAAP